MRILIGRTFKYDKEDKLFVRGRDYAVKKDLAEWITRHQLGTIIPEIKEDEKGKLVLKDLKGPPKDTMIKSEDVKTKKPKGR